MKQLLVNLTKTDWKLLKNQKKHLLSIVEMPWLNGHELEAVDGLINWIDNIQDQAAEQLGEKKVFGRLK